MIGCRYVNKTIVFVQVFVCLRSGAHGCMATICRSPHGWFHNDPPGSRRHLGLPLDPFVHLEMKWIHHPFTLLGLDTFN